MPQPNKGTHGTPHVQEPLMDKKMSAPVKPDLRFGYQDGGTHGSGKGAH